MKHYHSSFYIYFSQLINFISNEYKNFNEFNENKMKNLCLNMIVKNESKIITRLLESVVSYIDCYCICDTGSTDNTVEIIQEFFKKHKIEGVIESVPFINFQHNRNYALKMCEKMDVKYVLLLDADMIFKTVFTKEELWNILCEDVYQLYQGSEKMYYVNVRIIKNDPQISYCGVTHEYVKIPNNFTKTIIDKKDIYIIDIGDGGSKQNKFERDIQLLSDGLKMEPNNERYVFYLANSYFNANNHEKAIEHYKKRIQMGGWYEEIWYSHYIIGLCYYNVGKKDEAIIWWLKAFDYNEERIENLYEIIKHYRTEQKYKLAYEFYVIADRQRKKMFRDDYLFFHSDVYDHLMDYEITIIGFYYNPMSYDMNKICMNVLCYPFQEENLFQNVLFNYKFYSKKLCDFSDSSTNIFIDKLFSNIGNEMMEPYDNYVGSTPSITSINDKEILVNRRFVNYKINEDGSYNCEETISNKNIIAKINIENWKIEKRYLLKYDTTYDNSYVGLEDIKLHWCNNILYYNASRGLNSYKKISIEHGIIQNEMCVGKIIFKENQNDVEKNWVLFSDKNDVVHCIYKWNPLIIGNIIDGVFHESHNIETNSLFRIIRGSTNGIKIDNEIWFICHVVSDETLRYYYHLFVVLDIDTFQIKKFTPFFTFEGNRIEYTLGFSYLKKFNELMIGFSTMDRTTNCVVLKKSIIDEMFIV